jgi:hypothetical protein
VPPRKLSTSDFKTPRSRSFATPNWPS